MRSFSHICKGLQRVVARFSLMNSAESLPNMTPDHEAFCQGDYKAITTYLKGL